MATEKLFSGSFNVHTNTSCAHTQTLKNTQTCVSACSTDICTPTPTFIPLSLKQTQTNTHTHQYYDMHTPHTCRDRLHLFMVAIFFCLVVRGQNLWRHVEGFNASVFTLFSCEFCLLHLRLVCQYSFTMCISSAYRLTITLCLSFSCVLCPSV